MPVETGKVEGRRNLRFNSLDEVVLEAERLAKAGELRLMGNWSLGQILKHLADGMNLAIVPMDFRPPLFLRLIGPWLKKRMLKNAMPSGFKLPKELGQLLPSDKTSTEEGLAALRVAVNRVQTERLLPRHSFLGPMTRDEWLQFQMRHAELHLSFAVPGNS